MSVRILFVLNSWLGVDFIKMETILELLDLSVLFGVPASLSVSTQQQSSRFQGTFSATNLSDF